MSVLEVSNLSVDFESHTGTTRVVDNLHFELGARQTLGLVGESGSGKSQSALAILGLLAANGYASGSARLDGEEILNQPVAMLEKIRGRRIAMVSQDPASSLNPYLSIGTQLKLVLERHRQLTGAKGRREILKMLDAVGLPNAERRLNAHPHEFSGGMCQRIMIASALLCRPEFLIADEPTTALDVTVQASILDLLRELRDAFGMSILLISHDLGVVAGHCDRVLVMHNGLVVEQGATRELFKAPSHPYTKSLLAAVPKLSDSGRGLLDGTAEPLLQVDKLVVSYPLPKRSLLARPERFTAVKSVNLKIMTGETLGLVGESGCGKSSLARAIMQLARIDSGAVALLAGAATGDRLKTGRDLQMVFQDPQASLNPRMTARQIVTEPLLVHEPGLTRAARDQRVVEMFVKVGLDPEGLQRYAHEFSTGQCQRIAIARALITGPQLLVCDEALSALDASVQADITNLLLGLQASMGLAILFIAHDLAVVRRMCHRLAVMYLGQIVETGPAESLYEQPLHPYTRALLSAAPSITTERPDALPLGDIPAPWKPPGGCAYHTRCPYAEDQCRAAEPKLEGGPTLSVACHRVASLPRWSAAVND